MRNVPALTRRELVTYFCSPMAYIVLTILMAFAGVIFYFSLELQRVASLETWFIYMSVILLFLVPVVVLGLGFRTIRAVLRPSGAQLYPTSPVKPEPNRIAGRTAPRKQKRAEKKAPR